MELIEFEEYIEINLNDALLIVDMQDDFVPGGALPGAEWYATFKTAIYSFHMPFFMWISGFIARYTFRSSFTALGYRKYILTKAARLLPGFLLVVIIVLGGKLVLQQISEPYIVELVVDSMSLPLMAVLGSTLDMSWLLVPYPMAKVHHSLCSSSTRSNLAWQPEQEPTCLCEV